MIRYTTPDRPEPVGSNGRNIGASYTDEQRTFMMAMERYKRTTGRVYLTCREILTVAASLGYVKCKA